MWKRRIVWLLLILAAGTMYLFENGGATLAVLLVVVLVPLFGMLLPVLTLKRTEITVLLPERCACGEAVAGTLRCSGKQTLLPMTRIALLTVENQHTGEQTALQLSLRSGETAFSVTAQHCGVVRVTVAELSARDPFGLIERRVTVETVATLYALPELFQPEIFLTESAFAMLDSDQYATTNPGHDPSETFGIREYVPGDSIKTIHWKLSQKTSKTMIRELSLPVVHPVLLLYESRVLPETTATDIHAMTTALVSVSAALLESGVPHSIGWKQADAPLLALWEVDSEEAQIAALEALLALPPERDDTGLAACERAGGSFAHVAAITAAPIPNLTDLYNGSRITLMQLHAVNEGLQSDGTYLLPFDAETVTEQLGRIEL